MTINSQLGVKVESTYGTAVTPDRFYQVTSAKLKLDQYRGNDGGIRATGYGPRSDQQRVAVQGGTLELELPWFTKGMGWWLRFMLGATATTGPTDSAYTHTGTEGSLWGDVFTAQIDNPFTPSETSQPLTMAGCKISKWSLSCKEGGEIVFKPTVDFQSLATGTSLASASYPSGMEPMCWVDVGVTIAGTAVPVTEWSIDYDPKLNTKRYFQQSSALKAEPTAPSFRDLNLELTADFSSLTQFNRVRAATTSAAQSACIITATDTGQTIGSSTNPSLTATFNKVSWYDLDGLGIEQKDTMQKLKAMGLYDGTNSRLILANVNSDATA